MAWSGLFKEAATVGKRELTVKRQSYEEEDAVAIETWKDETLFKVRGLNHLRLMGFSNMIVLCPQISQLNALLELILTDNGLETLPEEIGSLSRLRLLDASHNQLRLLPHSFYELTSLQKLLLGHNSLTKDSFPDQSGMGTSLFPSLQYVNIANNQLEVIPQFVYQSTGLLEVLLPNNKIEVLSSDISNLSALRTLELTHNSLHFIPSELSLCSKLRSIAFDDNQIEDKRLVKILNQFGSTKPKAVFDYLSSMKSSKSSKGKGKKKKGGATADEFTDETIPTESFSHAKHVIKIVRPSQYVIIKSMNSARQIRPYLVCTVVRDLALDDDGALRIFITLQTKLHETVSKRRRLSTIATHSLSSLSLPLQYHSRVADKITFQPLGWDKTATVRQYLSYLKENGANEAKIGTGGKPCSVDVAAAHISKFLPLIDPSQMVYLADSTGRVISLPPLTNSEPSKITEESKDILIEVTSATSLADAKQAMSTLLVEMVQCGLKSEPIESADAVATPPSCTSQLIVEQVKVIDEADKLLVMYPSRPDLILDSSSDTVVVRPT